MSIYFLKMLFCLISALLHFINNHNPYNHDIWRLQICINVCVMVKYSCISSCGLCKVALWCFHLNSQ